LGHTFVRFHPGLPPGQQEISPTTVAQSPLERAAKTFGLGLGGSATANRRPLKFDELGGLQPAAGVTYSVQVKPDNKETWDTIAVSRPTPDVDVDRNQFAGAKRATIRVLRTTGFNEDVIAEDTIDLK